MQKWNLREKLGKENLNWKSQPQRKVNGQSQQHDQSQQSNLKSQWSNSQSQKMTSADDASKWRQQWRNEG